MIKAVIFDIGGVLLDYSLDNLIKRISEKFSISKDEVHKLLKIDLDAIQKGDISEETYFKRFAKRVDGDFRDDCKDLWFRDIIRNSRINKNNFEIVKKLKKTKYKVGVLSNTIKTHSDYLRNKFDPMLFDAYTLSCEIGFVKPQKQAYKIVLKSLNSDADSSIFIDDDAKFIKAAEDIGMNGIIYKSHENLKQDLRKLGVFI